VRSPQDLFNKKENSFSAPPKAAAGETEKSKEEDSARSRLGRSGEPPKNESYHLRDLTPEEIEQARRIHEMTKNL
jgi:tRNA U34 2-thiouridine synthase MnmA/TrmU